MIRTGHILSRPASNERTSCLFMYLSLSVCICLLFVPSFSFKLWGKWKCLSSGSKALCLFLFAPCGVTYPWRLLLDVWGQAARRTPDPSSPPHHLRQPSTNAQRSWTTSIWGIILYEIDGWGQPLTERVKTTLRCPLWISMMENRLLKKIYVCSPLPQEEPGPPPSDQSNMSLWSD